MEPEEMDWWDVVSGLLDEVDFWNGSEPGEEVTPQQALEHLLECLRDADRCKAHLHARAEAAEAARDRMRAQAEELEAQLNAEVMDQFDEVRMRVEAEAERDRLTEALERIESICDAALCGPPEGSVGKDFYEARARWYLVSTMKAWKVARAALSGGDDA